MRNLTFLIFNLLIFQTILILPDEVRKQFFLQYAKEITLETKTDDYLDTYLDAINYDKKKIEELIKKYNFPDSYNFVNETNAEVHVKNQKKCGCCWAMASTTSLAYRFHKKNITVDLSPQHELSCYLRDCVYGNNVNDPELSLIKNGTITEECLPFSSGDEIIEECPVNNTCKNPSVPYIKYYAKNAYSIGITENNFYDVTAIIMDQLVTKGPVVTSITAYDDFQKFGGDKNCTNKVYTYDGVSGNLGGHALTLVGYGYLDDKYYWLIQNSWGDKWCNDGFAKIEFGQVGIGTIGLAEPFIEEEESTETINIEYVSQNLDCQIEISADDFNLTNWTNPLNIIFSHENGLHDFNYICGVNKLITEGKEKIYCYYEYLNKRFYKGLYKYKSFQSIGKGNNFVLDNAFKELKFNYYGYDEIFPLSIAIQGLDKYNTLNFVSEKGSRITFFLKTEDIEKNITPIKANNQHNIPLKNCTTIKSITFTINRKEYILSYCEIDEDELDYFYYYPDKNSSSMLLRRECGYFHYQNIYTYRLDKNKYPVFRIKHFIASHNYQSTLTALLLADVEGSISEYAENKNNFYVLVGVETNNKVQISLMICPTGNPKKIGENYAILCSSEFTTEDKINSMYLLPLYGILQSDYPFEIIIKDIMESEDFIPPTPTPTPMPTPSIGKYLELSFTLILFFALFL